MGFFNNVLPLTFGFLSLTTLGSDVCLKIYNLKEVPKGLQGGM